MRGQMAMILSVILTFVIVTLANTGLDKGGKDEEK